ncbi:hypothetical protein AVEN_126643-1 [Araneus ventricosus]|uniref:Uncharacterized protein n=1 Tax=Araneus ventricosus TaxID=182803 RepID=A0A4Y2K388_ARAVE|nr:hypothetical protein AVEN_126643-1 [Araneus ventricosus]
MNQIMGSAYLFGHFEDAHKSGPPLRECVFQVPDSIVIEFAYIQMHSATLGKVPSLTCRCRQCEPKRDVLWSLGKWTNRRLVNARELDNNAVPMATSQ